MKMSRWIKELSWIFLGALAVYILAYKGIEGRRTQDGPWQVCFTNQPGGSALIHINQPGIGITNVLISFPDCVVSAASFTGMPLFDQARTVPFAAGFGRCVFQDAVSMPGTIVLEVFGHEIQLLPRVLTIDKKEQPWKSESTITLYALRPGK